MKASRLAAIGLVDAAGLWIASGHFLPHETAESRAAIRDDRHRAVRQGSEPALPGAPHVILRAAEIDFAAAEFR